jgi:hypothetical protein
MIAKGAFQATCTLRICVWLHAGKPHILSMQSGYEGVVWSSDTCMGWAINRMQQLHVELINYWMIASPSSTAESLAGCWQVYRWLRIWQIMWLHTYRSVPGKCPWALKHNSQFWTTWAVTWDITSTCLYKSCYINPLKYGTWALARGPGDSTVLRRYIHTLYLLSMWYCQMTNMP